MRRLETMEIRAALADLLTKRQDALGKVTYGAEFKAQLERLLTALDALPKGLQELPLVDVLALLDGDHDAWARALDHLLAAVEEGPDALAALLPVVALARQRYIAGRSETQKPYAVEAQKGTDRLKTVDADAATLDQITGVDGRPLSAWVRAYATAGTKLGDTLSSRADAVTEATSARDGAATVQALRAEAQRVVRELRDQITADLKRNPSVPKTLLGDVLGNLDELSRLAEQRALTPKAAAPETTPES